MYVKLTQKCEWKDYDLTLDKGTIIEVDKMEDITKDMDLIERNKDEYTTIYNGNLILLSSDEVVEVEVKEVE